MHDAQYFKKCFAYMIMMHLNLVEFSALDHDQLLKLMFIHDHICFCLLSTQGTVMVTSLEFLKRLCVREPVDT